MYSQATRECADEMEYNYSVGSKAKDFKKLLEEATREFRFESCVNKIPTDFDNNNVPQNHRNRFTDYVDLTRDNLLKSDSITWGNGINADGSYNYTIDEIKNNYDILQLRLRSFMLVKYIKELLTIPEKKNLML